MTKDETPELAKDAAVMAEATVMAEEAPTLPWPPTAEELQAIRALATRVYRHWQDTGEGRVSVDLTLDGRDWHVGVNEGIVSIADTADYRRTFIVPGRWIPHRRAAADDD